MAKVVKHAWTHRPRSEGGTDPIDVASFEPSWCAAQMSSTSISKASGYYTILFQDMGTNDTDCFEFFSTAGSSSAHVSILKTGYYVCHFSMSLNATSPYWGGNDAQLLPTYRTTGGSSIDIANEYYFKTDFYEFLARNSMHPAADDADTQGLYIPLSFHWDPNSADNQFDQTTVLPIGLRVDTDLTGNQDMQAQMLLIRIATAGYTTTSLPLP